MVAVVTLQEEDIMRTLTPARWVLALLLIAAPVSAQAPLSDRQLRQMAGYSLDRVGNVEAEVAQMRARLQTIYDAIHARIVADSLAGTTPPDTTTPPPPPPPDTTTPPPDPPPPGDWDIVVRWDDGQLNQPNFDPWHPDRMIVREGGPFTTPYHLEIRQTTNDWIEGHITRLDEPQVGQTVTATWEMTWETAVSGQTTHGFYFDDDMGGVNWGPPTLGLSIEDRDDRWMLGVWTGGDPFRGGFRAGTSMANGFLLTKGHPYEVELSYTRTGSNTYTVGVEVRELDGTVVLETSDFTDWDYFSGSYNLATTTFTQSNAGAEHMTGFRIGNNGLDVRAGVTTIARIANLRLDVR